MTHRSLRVAAGVLLLAIVAAGVVWRSAGHFLVAPDALSPTDAILVLGGESSGFWRTRQALTLYEQGYAPIVVFSGGSLADAGLACSSASLSLEAAGQLGLPADAALILDGAGSTYDEAVNFHRLASQRGWRSVIVVTDIFHTRRAGNTFRALLPSVRISVSAAPNPRFDPAHWQRTEDGLVAVVNEYLKLAFYWFHYGISPL
jgi:uncharacterized SAM-binding protein YcdF (DUF218 family)